MSHSVELTRPLRGIVPPMVTPLADRDILDVDGLDRLIEHILAGGVHGLFVLGTTGEGPSLGDRLQKELIGRVCEQVNGRVPVLVGITDASFTESVQLARLAAEAGASGVVLAPPFYFPVAQAELLEYTKRIAGELPLPVFLYNMPSHTKLSFELETLRPLFDHPNIAGLKDSSGEMVYFHSVRHLAAGREDFTLLVGPEQLLAESVLLGGHGGVSGGANLFPKLFVDLYHAASAGDLERVRELHRAVMNISATLYTIGRYGAGFIKGLKCALSCLNICSDLPAEPLLRLSPEERKEVDRCLQSLPLDEYAGTPSNPPARK